MRSHVTLAMSAICFAGTALLTAGQSSRDALTIQQVMATMTVPGSDAVFAAASETPSWDAVVKGAALVEESGALLMTGPRVKDRDGWLRQARELVARAEAARRIAETTRDVDALIEAADRLYDTCKACHDRYPPTH